MHNIQRAYDCQAQGIMGGWVGHKALENIRLKLITRTASNLKIQDDSHCDYCFSPRNPKNAPKLIKSEDINGEVWTLG